MFGDQGHKEILDRAAKNVLRAARATDAETEKAAAAPFLFARIRARIAEEKGRPQSLQEPSLIWGLIWGIARRALPALALIAVVALGSFWVFGNRPAVSSSSVSETATGNTFLMPAQPSLVVTACSLAAKDECAVSTGDVMALLMNTTEGQSKQ